MVRLLRMHLRTQVRRKNKERNKKTICRHIKEQDILKKIMRKQVNL